MKCIRLIILPFAIVYAVQAAAQSKVGSSNFVSGDYDELKVSCDNASKSFTIIVTNVVDGLYSCDLFMCGKMIKNKEGKYPLKAYPYGFDGEAFSGTLLFHQGKHKNENSIEIQLSESGSCQNMVDFKGGLTIPLDKIYPYHKFSMVRSKKALAYKNGSQSSHTKGYLLQGDFVSILSENKDFCQVEYVNKPSFKAWLKKTDLIL